MLLEDVAHFCWSDVFGGETVAPGEFKLVVIHLNNNCAINIASCYLTSCLNFSTELTEWHRQGRPWYGDETVIEKWASWL